jgi:site-specific DNA-methyltransferase (cytosine-N4-specific)
MMPISPFVTRGKLLNYCAEKILNDFQQIFPAKQYDFGFEVAAEYLHKCFPHQQLTKLLHLRYSIMQMSDPARTFFIIALLNILKRISFTKNDGAFLRFKTNVTPETLEETFPPQVKMMLEDLLPVSDFYYCPSVVRADARRIPLKDNTIDGVITSPPYLNRHDYTRIYALELLFNFLQDNEELKRLRYKMLRSNVEARRTVNILHYQPPARLEKLIAKLRASQLPNRKVIDMVWGYFEDMYGVLNELYRVLKPGALMAFVVGNCKYGGIMFPVDELLREIGENLGFKTLKIIVARYRGNAPQQMKKFGKESARESIVIWEKEK